MSVGVPTPWRVRLIVNPASSAVTNRVRDVTRHALASFDLTEVETARRDHATDLAREAAAEGVDVVVVLGGDGTVNEAANGLLDTGTALATLPGGSTNVFARTLGMAPKAAAAAPQLTAALGRRSTRRIGTGSANGRAFLFHAGVGFDAAVVAQVEQHASLKRTIGQGIFVYAAFATWFRHYDHSRPQFSLELPDGTRVDEGYFTICLLTNPYTFLGPRPLNVAPGATGEAGLTAVTLRTLRVGSLLSVVGKALGTGDGVARHRDTDVRRDLPSLTIRAYDRVPLQVDGDYLGEVTEVELRHQPDRLTVVVPPPA
jgi:diacylglycerol kinase family enzyme